jgi:hypothetical protein
MIRMTKLPSAINQDALQALRQQHPWPVTQPSVAPVDWSLDGGGRWLVQKKLRQHKSSVVLEIGCFLGGSMLDWLSVSPHVQVVGVDPWPDDVGVAQYAREQGKSEAVAQQLDQPDGFYQTFLANLWQHRDRVVPVRGYSPAVLHELAEIGFMPDLIYLDSDKVGNEIEFCHDLFPGAVMTGDDWGWQSKTGEYPIREPVKAFCDKHQRYLKVEGATWVIDTEPASISFRFRAWRRAMRSRRKNRRAAA